MADTMMDSNTSSGNGTPPNHLGTSVPSGALDNGHGHGHDPEKMEHHHEMPASAEKKMDPDDEDDEDMDALIDDLESQDGHVDEEGILINLYEQCRKLIINQCR